MTAAEQKQYDSKLTDEAGNPIFKVERKGSMVKWMNDDGTFDAASKTEFSRKFRTEEEWNDFYNGKPTAEDLETKTETTVEEPTEEYQAQDFTGDELQDYVINLSKLFNLEVAIPEVKVEGRANIDYSTKTFILPRKFWAETQENANFAVRVVHELIHYYNQHSQINDTCGGGAYHNDKFKEVADLCHLTAEKTRGQGWGNTHITITPAFASKTKNLTVPAMPAYVQEQLERNARIQESTSSTSKDTRIAQLESRVDTLEVEVAELKEMLSKLVTQ
jgi:hypothetical protein